MAKKCKLPYDGLTRFSIPIKQSFLTRRCHRAAMAGLQITNKFPGAKNMGKEHKNIKAEKKKPAMSPKEKKAAKKAKKAARKG
jgi:hypothetical protein